MDDAERLRQMEEAERAGGQKSPATRRLRESMRMLAAFGPAARGVCPTREELVAWFDQELDTEPMRQLGAHLDVCPFCAAELADLEALARPPLLEAVVLMASEGLRLLSHTFREAHLPALAPARGEEVGGVVELSASSEDLLLNVRLHPGSSGAADVRLNWSREGEPLDRARLNLLRGDALLESRLAAAREEVVFGDVPAGRYAVTIAPLGGDEVARMQLTLGVEER